MSACRVKVVVEQRSVEFVMGRFGDVCGKCLTGHSPDREKTRRNVWLSQSTARQPVC